MINVIIVCSDEYKIKAIEENFSKGNKICVAEKVTDGKSAFRSILNCNYSAAVVYMGLNGNDGLWVIEQLNRINYNGTKIIAVNDVKNKMFSELAMLNGADHCLTEPFDVDIIQSRIIQLCSRNDYNKNENVKNTKSSTKAITLSEVINKIGIRPSLKGYGYIKYAVNKVVENPRFMTELTKGLYPEVAVEFNTQPKCVERNIRHCIDISWNNAKSEYKNVFGYEFYKKPTNKELINSLAEYLNEKELNLF